MRDKLAKLFCSQKGACGYNSDIIQGSNWKKLVENNYFQLSKLEFTGIYLVIFEKKKCDR